MRASVSRQDDPSINKFAIPFTSPFCIADENESNHSEPILCASRESAEKEEIPRRSSVGRGVGFLIVVEGKEENSG